VLRGISSTSAPITFDVARHHLGADVDDPALVQVARRVVGHVGDLAGDLLGTQLGVPGLDLELVDVDRGVLVILDDVLREQDGVLEVVALPGHERHQHVAAERHLAVLDRRAVGQDVPHVDVLTGA